MGSRFTRIKNTRTLLRPKKVAIGGEFLIYLDETEKSNNNLAYNFFWAPNSLLHRHLLAFAEDRYAEIQFHQSDISFLNETRSTRCVFANANQCDYVAVAGRKTEKIISKLYLVALRPDFMSQ